MLELVVTFCLLKDASDCKERIMTYSEESVTLMQLMGGAQPEIAKWMEGHPGHFAKKWTVRRAGQYAKI